MDQRKDFEKKKRGRELVASTMCLISGSEHPPSGLSGPTMRLFAEVSLVTAQVSGKGPSLNGRWINNWSVCVVLKQKPDDDEEPWLISQIEGQKSLKRGHHPVLEIQIHSHMDSHLQCASRGGKPNKRKARPRVA